MNYRKSLKILQKRTFQTLVFLLPTQLAFHFWPSWSYVYGIRIDYLAPAVYLTDIVLLFLLITLLVEKAPWIYIRDIFSACFVGAKSAEAGNCSHSSPSLWSRFSAKVNKKTFSLKRLTKTSVAAFSFFVVFVVINVIGATNYNVALLKWMKFVELAFLVFYIVYKKDFSLKEWVKPPLFFALIFFGFIALAQFYFQGSLGGLLYYFGERSFNASTPGIALYSVLGKTGLRAYSTFSHPNSLAGFFTVGFFLLARPSKTFSFSIFKKIAGLVCLTVLFISFSIGSWVALLFGILVLSLFHQLQADPVPPRAGMRRSDSEGGVAQRRRKKLPASVLGESSLKSKKVFSVLMKLVFWALVFISFLTLIISRDFEKNLDNYPDKITKRVELTKASGEIFSAKPLFGAGLNNFIVELPKTSLTPSVVWWLQPTHNIFLLTLSEAGLIGLLVFVVVFYRALSSLLSCGRQYLAVALLVIVITGVVDHYWLTLQQNQLLLAIILGLSFRKNIS